MPETSGPRVTGTDAERQFDDLMWRDMFGSEAGVVGDIDGSAYKLTLPSGSNFVSVGSTTQPSLSVVGGFRHRISAGDTQSVEFAPVVGTARTDLLVARLNLLSFTGAPGPVRLVAIQGTSTSIPTFDDAAPGVEDLPLWSITRQPGQSLAQAVTKRLFTRISPVLGLAPDALLPPSAPLDTIVRQGDVEYRRVLDSVGLPAWRRRNTLLKSRHVVGTASGNLTGSVNLAPAQTVLGAPFGLGQGYRLAISARTKATMSPGLGVKLELMLNGTVFAADEFSNAGTTSSFETVEVNDIAYITSDSSQVITAVLTSLGGQISIQQPFSRLIIEAEPFEGL